MRALSLLCNVLVLFALACAPAVYAAELTAEKTDQGVSIKIDGQPFANYVAKGAFKPYVWPIYGPTQKKMTRDFPMIEHVPGESKDHPHQRSMWFTHGDVNGVDFWAETPKSGKIVQRELARVAGGHEAVVVTREDWLGPDGKKVCTDDRTMTFGGDKGQRWIDFSISIHASEGPVAFGDTKEGSFGLRVADSMTVDAKHGGQIVSSEGKTDAAAWAQPAAWVDYHGPIDGETLGIAILNHPSSFRFPTFWHVRTYGLFAANPFGKKDFKTTKQGAYDLPQGESVFFRYRVIFHQGDQRAAKIAEAFAEYSKEQKN
ncbi:MAG TPA: PmoA family protein [Pirellulales bacterium]|jgi:hypothetical protein|nr:PmoA family protein [Pirellulales bacterium]